jgi:hypothetical protein
MDMGNIFQGNGTKDKDIRKINQKGREFRIWVVE